MTCNQVNKKQQKQVSDTRTHTFYICAMPMLGLSDNDAANCVGRNAKEREENSSHRGES